MDDEKQESASTEETPAEETSSEEMTETPPPEKQAHPCIEIKVAEDQMAASLLLHAPADDVEPLTLELIREHLKEKGVTSQINNDAIKELLSSETWDEARVVAQGVAPVHGKGVTLDIHFPTEISQRPKVNEDGSVDYKEINVVHSTKADELLVTLVPPVPGTDGQNIAGEVVPAAEGVDETLTLGAGVAADPEDDSKIKAIADGIICYDAKSQKLEIQDVYSVAGSVDYSTGNINVESAVSIKEDVHPGFSITTPYSVEIQGVLEGGPVKCGGSLKVGLGILGDKEGSIYAKGDIHSGYISSQNVLSAGSIYVDKEIRYSVVESHDEIVVVNDQGLILGGRTVATQHVTAANIGSDTNAETHIEVGVCFKTKEKVDQKQQAIDEQEAKIGRYQEKISKIVHSYKGMERQRMLVPLKKEWGATQEKMKALQDELSELEKGLYSVENPYVCVKGTVYPGVVIKIKKTYYRVQSPLSHTKFRLEDGAVVSVSL